MNGNEENHNMEISWQRIKRRRTSHETMYNIQPANEVEFTHSNQFDLLSNHDEEVNNTSTKENSSVNQVPRIPKPPPIYIYDVLNFSEMANSISKIINKNEYICKALINSTIKINVTTSESFRKLSKYLKENNIIHHTYQPKEDRSFRVVLRNLHHSADIEEIKFELAEKGFNVRNIINIKHKSSKEPFPLFFLDLEPSENNKDIYNIRYLLNTKIVVEPPRKNKDIPQCTRCQSFNHTKSYCFKNYRCVKCGGPHASQSCTKPRETPPTCSNCSGNHPANYKGCSTYKDLQKRRGLPSQNKTRTYNDNKKHQPQIQATNLQPPQQTHFPNPLSQNSHQRTQTSYASAAHNENHENHSSQINDINIMLTSFMNEFKSLFSQLLNQNSTILNLLTKVISNNGS